MHSVCSVDQVGSGRACVSCVGDERSGASGRGARLSSCAGSWQSGAAVPDTPRSDDTRWRRSKEDRCCDRWSRLKGVASGRGGDVRSHRCVSVCKRFYACDRMAPF